MRMLLAALALVAAVSIAPATAATSGLHGVVTKGPTSPVCRVGTPCSAPVADVRVSFVHGTVVHSTTTDAHGRYAIALAPGRYAVRVAVLKARVAPATVTVMAGTSRLQNITLDTGIR